MSPEIVVQSHVDTARRGLMKVANCIETAADALTDNQYKHVTTFSEERGDGRLNVSELGGGRLKRHGG